MDGLRHTIGSIHRQSPSQVSTSPPAADGPRTDAEFREQLGALLGRADHNGVDVTGGYAFRDERRDAPYLGVEIYEVVPSGRGGNGDS